MIEKHYTKEDSEEVRKTYFEALRKFKQHTQTQMLITKKEWDSYLEQGRDMGRYEIWQLFKRRVETEVFKKKRAARLRYLVLKRFAFGAWITRTERDEAQRLIRAIRSEKQ